MTKYRPIAVSAADLDGEAFVEAFGQPQARRIGYARAADMDMMGASFGGTADAELVAKNRFTMHNWFDEQVYTRGSGRIDDQRVIFFAFQDAATVVLRRCIAAAVKNESRCDGFCIVVLPDAEETFFLSGESKADDAEAFTQFYRLFASRIVPINEKVLSPRKLSPRRQSLLQRRASFVEEHQHDAEEKEEEEVIAKTKAKPSLGGLAMQQKLARSSAIVVAVRIRPLNSREIAKGDTVVFARSDDGAFCTVLESGIPGDAGGNDNVAEHVYDVVFDSQDDTELMYRTCAQRSVENALDGYNSTFFAYGQTGSGKTWTLFGDGEERPGITTLCINALFEAARARAADFLVRLSYLELYNEKLKDLLGDDPTQPSQVLRIIDDPMLGTIVHGVNEINVTSVAEALELIDHGEAHRAFGSTSMNAHSSRSHVILTMVIECKAQDDGEGSGTSVSRFHLVDLAGSERASNTGASGAQLREGAAINKSLSTLSQVIKGLASTKKGAHAHVPYRDSKLTRMLQSSLGGNAKTTVVCCVSPAASNREQTKSTLTFAASAGKISNKARQNRIHDKNSLLATYRKEIKRLRHQLEGSDIGELRMELANAQADAEAMRHQLESGDGANGAGGGAAAVGNDGEHQGCAASELQALEKHAEKKKNEAVPALDKHAKHSLAVEKRLRVEAEAEAALLRSQLRKWTAEARELGVLPLLTPVSADLGKEDARRRKESAKRQAAKDAAMITKLAASLDMHGGVKECFQRADKNGDRVLSARELFTFLEQNTKRGRRVLCTLRDCARIAAAAGEKGLTLGNLLRVVGGALKLPAEGTLDKPKGPTAALRRGRRAVRTNIFAQPQDETPPPPSFLSFLDDDEEEPPPPPLPDDDGEVYGAASDEVEDEDELRLTSDDDDDVVDVEANDAARKSRVKEDTLIPSDRPIRQIHGVAASTNLPANLDTAGKSFLLYNVATAEEGEKLSVEDQHAAEARGKERRKAIEAKMNAAKKERAGRRAAIEQRRQRRIAEEKEQLESRKKRRPNNKHAVSQAAVAAVRKSATAGTRHAAVAAVEGKARRARLEAQSKKRAAARKHEKERVDMRESQLKIERREARVSTVTGAREQRRGGKPKKAAAASKRAARTSSNAGPKESVAKTSRKLATASKKKGTKKKTKTKAGVRKKKADAVAAASSATKKVATDKSGGNHKLKKAEAAAALAAGSSSDDDDLMAEFEAHAKMTESALHNAVPSVAPAAAAPAADTAVAPAVAPVVAPAAATPAAATDPAAAPATAPAANPPAPAVKKAPAKKKKKKKKMFGLF